MLVALHISMHINTCCTTARAAAQKSAAAARAQATKDAADARTKALLEAAAARAKAGIYCIHATASFYQHFIYTILYHVISSLR
jgi:hypothetical protein